MAIKPKAPSVIGAILSADTPLLPPIKEHPPTEADVTFTEEGPSVHGEAAIVRKSVFQQDDGRSRAHQQCAAQEAALVELGNALGALEEKLGDFLVPPAGAESVPSFQSDAALRVRQNAITERARWLTHEILQLCERVDA